MAYTRKTKDEYAIQGNYGTRWEDVTVDETYKEARQSLKDYNDNEPQYPHRLIKRRVKLADARL
jgi:hypothetical protein